MQANAVQSALRGMNKAKETVDEAARHIASGDESGEGRDIIEDIVDLRLGKHMLEANALVLKKEMETQENLIDILA